MEVQQLSPYQQPKVRKLPQTPDHKGCLTAWPNPYKIFLPEVNYYNWSQEGVNFVHFWCLQIFWGLYTNCQTTVASIWWAEKLTWRSGARDISTSQPSPDAVTRGRIAILTGLGKTCKSAKRPGDSIEVQHESQRGKDHGTKTHLTHEIHCNWHELAWPCFIWWTGGRVQNSGTCYRVRHFQTRHYAGRDFSTTVARQNQVLKPMIIGRAKLSDGKELQQQLYDTTLEEAGEKNWLEGPFQPSQIDDNMGSNWLPVRRFGVLQKDKLRPIDDFKENQVNNKTFASSEKLELRTMDHTLWSLFTVLKFLLFDGRLDFLLSSGEHLCAEVHPAWKSVEPNFKTSCIDLKSAYKQLPLNEDNYKDSVVTIWNPDKKCVECFVMKVLPFGAAASVHHFLRVSIFLQAVGRYMGSLWSAFFDDFVFAQSCNARIQYHDGGS